MSMIAGPGVPQHLAEGWPLRKGDFKYDNRYHKNVSHLFPWTKEDEEEEALLSSFSLHARQWSYGVLASTRLLLAGTQHIHSRLDTLQLLLAEEAPSGGVRVGGAAPRTVAGETGASSTPTHGLLLDGDDDATAADASSPAGAGGRPQRALSGAPPPPPPVTGAEAAQYLALVERAVGEQGALLDKMRATLAAAKARVLPLLANTASGAAR